MKVKELLEGKKWTNQELFAIAMKVGNREFGKSTQGFISAPLSKVHHLDLEDIDDFDDDNNVVGTYSWVFYPSDPKKFVDYSDQSYSEVVPDADGKIYIMDGISGDLYIISGGKAKSKIKNPYLEVLKKNQSW